jgi:hypothetical protein
LLILPFAYGQAVSEVGNNEVDSVILDACEEAIAVLRKMR